MIQDPITGNYFSLVQRLALQSAAAAQVIPMGGALTDFGTGNVKFPLSGQQAFRIVEVNASVYDVAGSGKIIPVQFAIGLANIVGSALVDAWPCTATMGLPLGDIGLFIGLDLPSPIYVWNDYVGVGGMDAGGLSDGGGCQLFASGSAYNADAGADHNVFPQLNALVEIYQVSTEPPRALGSAGFGFPHSGIHSGALAGK